MNDTVRSYDLADPLVDDLSSPVEGAGRTDVSVSTGVAGQRGETWLEVSAVCGSVTR